MDNKEHTMTFEEYNNKMDEYKNRLSKMYGTEWDKLYNEISKFQQAYMENILSEYEETIDCTAKKHIYNILLYAVRISTSGSAIEHVETKEIADAIEKILWEEIGDYLLDHQIYEENNCWAIDCMFSGYYVPYWDGWC